MRVFVPDASVILKWVLPPENEPHSEQALWLRDSFIEGELDLLVPSLWYFEVGNLIGREYPAFADEILGSLRNLAMREEQLSERAESKALRLMRDHGVSFYDACYHALAETHGAIFVTADRKYQRRVGSTTHLLGLAELPMQG